MWATIWATAMNPTLAHTSTKSSFWYVYRVLPQHRLLGDSRDRFSQAVIIEHSGIEALLNLVAGGPWKEAASQSLLLLTTLVDGNEGELSSASSGLTTY